MLLADLVATSQAVGATRSRKAKAEALAGALRSAEAGELETVVAYLGGTLRQRRTGLGWRGVSDLPEPAEEPTLTVSQVHEAFEAIGAIGGTGSQAARRAAVADLFGRATADEQAWLRGLVTGEVRQGALDAQVQEAVAAVADVPLAAVRRAAMLAGSTLSAAVAAFDGGEEALAAIGLEVGRPVLPMLASSAPDVAAALDKMAGASVAIDAKLDGIRIQVHRDGDDVLVVTRSLDDITGRLPEVVDIARSLPAARFVLDGEALLLSDDGRPRPFQETSSRTAQAGGGVVAPYFFDVLHVDGRDLLDAPGHERLAALDALVPARHRVDRLVLDTAVDDTAPAEAFVEATLAAGHEGVVVKHLDARYEAGRRGAGWIKVKPVHTLDLVVLAVEWGSGRRRGWLSNIHLGARDPDGGFVMLGKTFKGMTDEMLAWQTERFTELATSPTDRSDHVVQVRPEQVVEVAFDGLQRSTRYPGGLALRFARVLRYRDDKTAADADTIDDVRALLP
jgi:DNA ligase 1